MFSTVTETTLREAIPQQAAPAAPATLGVEESRLVLGNKQMAATAFVVLTLITVIATLSYVVGRSLGDRAPAAATGSVPAVAAGPATVAPQMSQQVPQQAPEQVIIVEPKPAAAAPALAAPVVTAPWNPELPPAAGTVFYQVASVDKGMADVSVQYLQEKGFAARRAPGASAGLYRVLVGPLEAGQPMLEAEAKLKGLGFTPFPKKY
ncbi:MAG: hypothetical protein J0L64_08440 [Acidobacteria bacterium]|nr:hypothetical protein [Acidobacteriota bacterium]